MSTFTLSVRRRDLAWALALVVMLSAVWVARSDYADAGGTPPGEGIAVVYVAVGTGFPDALGVGPGAGADAGPIIVLPTNPPIPASSSAELVRLDPRTLIIVGGTAVISADMETELGGLLPNAVISRIAGANRYETNAAFSAATFPIQGWASIPAAAFTANAPATETVFITTQAYNSTNGSLWAPIQLPHGAEILELKINLNDTDGGLGQDISVYLQRANNAGGGEEVASTSTASGFAGGLTTVSTTTIVADREIVDNENYGYLVKISGADGNPLIYNVMVRYRLGVSNG